MNTDLLQKQNEHEIKELKGDIETINNLMEMISRRPELLVKALESAREGLDRDLFYAQHGDGG